MTSAVSMAQSYCIDAGTYETRPKVSFTQQLWAALPLVDLAWISSVLQPLAPILGSGRDRTAAAWI